MGLFDDILKKPASIPMPPADPLAGSGPIGQGNGGSSAGDDRSSPVIVKTEEAIVFGANTEAEMLQANMPIEPTVHAEEDYSSVLVAETSSTPTSPLGAQAVSTPQIISVPDVSSLPVAPTIQVMPTPTATIVTPVEAAPVAPITPVTLAVTPPSPVSTDALASPQGPSLFDHIMADTPVAETPVVVSAPSMFTGFAETPIVAPRVEGGVPETIAVAPVPVTTSPHGNFSTPREFIEKSLASIALMLENIESRHSTKKAEEDGYRKEKMRFAELEKNAYVEAEIMDRERDHALRMQSMFQAELDTDSANREKKVVHTDKHLSSKKKQHEEEEVLIAS